MPLGGVLRFGKTQLARVQRSGRRSPLSCSVVIFATRASKSTLDNSLQTDSSRRARSRWTESSLSAGFISRQLGADLLLDRDHPCGFDMSPLDRGGVAERQGRMVGAALRLCCLAYAHQTA
jgi:hypothetical protein